MHGKFRTGEEPRFPSRTRPSFGGSLVENKTPASAGVLFCANGNGAVLREGNRWEFLRRKSGGDEQGRLSVRPRGLRHLSAAADAAPIAVEWRTAMPV